MCLCDCVLLGITRINRGMNYDMYIYTGFCPHAYSGSVGWLSTSPISSGWPHGMRLYSSMQWRCIAEECPTKSAKVLGQQVL